MALNFAGAIIAAGTGERLRKAVAGLPKPLVETGGQTLLARQATAMIDAGADPLLAVVGSETAALIAQRRVELPSALELYVRDTPNSMETLFTIGEKLAQGRFLLSTVDVILPHSQFRQFAARALELTDGGASGTLDGALGLVQWRGDRRPLFAEVGSDGLITALGDRWTSLVTAGLYMLSTGIFRFVDQARAAKLSAMREFLAHLIGAGMRLGAIELAGVIDVDEADDLAAARAMLAEEHRAAGASTGRR